jgi:DNA repair protein RecN (Recombination protein N)
MELLRYQLDELESAKLSTPDEDLRLAEEQEALSRAAEHRAAAALAHELLAGEEQVCDRLGHVVARVAGHPPLASLHSRLRSLAAELADAAEEARSLAESLEDDPERLAEVTERRALLHELRRKYGGQAPPSPAAPTAQGAAGPGSRAGQVRSSGGLEEVFQWRQAAEARLEKLESLSEEASRLASEHSAALAQLAAAAGELGRARREAAGRLGRAVEVELRRLAMPRAHFSVQVGGPGLASIEGSDFEQVGAPSREPSSSHEHADEDMGELSGENVCFLFAANAGEAKMPLAKVASGGELARVMLALRLVLLAGAGPLDAASEACGVAGGEGSGGRPGDGGERLGSPEGHWTEPAGPGTLVFDEVDAGIGGEAALAVGRALAELGERYQVVVVTHLPQVAAFAKSQIVVSKSERAGRTVATAAPVSGDERVVELSRMLSGQPGSKTARLHAEELLRTAAGGPSAGFGAGGPRARRR